MFFYYYYIHLYGIIYSTQLTIVVLICRTLGVAEVILVPKMYIIWFSTQTRPVYYKNICYLWSFANCLKVYPRSFKKILKLYGIYPMGTLLSSDRAHVTSSATWGTFIQHITKTQTCDDITIQGTTGKIRTR